MLELQNITFGFGNGKPLLNNLSLSLEQGKVYALMGANGSGKTTLFNLITGFYKPFQGQIFFRGNDITNLPAFKINLNGIGRTFQDLRVITKLTVRENVLLAMKGDPTGVWYKALLPQSYYKKEITELGSKADAIIQEYFLAAAQNSLAGEISYGQQKLLTLACCVANNAELLLLDEPVAGIQPEYRVMIAALIRKIKEHDKTVLLIEHNTDFIDEVADKIFFLNDGKTFDFNNVELLRADKLVMEAYM